MKLRILQTNNEEEIDYFYILIIIFILLIICYNFAASIIEYYKVKKFFKMFIFHYNHLD